MCMLVCINNNKRKGENALGRVGEREHGKDWG